MSEQNVKVVALLCPMYLFISANIHLLLPMLFMPYIYTTLLASMDFSPSRHGSDAEETADLPLLW